MLLSWNAEPNKNERTLRLHLAAGSIIDDSTLRVTQIADVSPFAALKNEDST